MLLKEGVLQCGARTDALLWVIGQHLVEQRQGGGGHLGDEVGDPAALPRGEVEAHSPRPAPRSRQEAAFLMFLPCTSLQLISHPICVLAPLHLNPCHYVSLSDASPVFSLSPDFMLKI